MGVLGGREEEREQAERRGGAGSRRGEIIRVGQVEPVKLIIEVN